MNTIPSSLISAVIALGLTAGSLTTGAHSAQDDSPSTDNLPVSNEIEEIEVIARGQPCRPALTHIPAPDVTYAPGISATGRDVTPADLNGAVTPTLPETVTFDILVTPPTNGDDSRLEGTIGKIKTDLASGATTVLGRTYTPASAATTCDGHRKQ